MAEEASLSQCLKIDGLVVDTIDSAAMVETAEVWHSISDFIDYEVSNLGHVRSLKYGGPRLMMPVEDRQGYTRVMLRRDGASVVQSVHKLVLEAFVELRPLGSICKWINNVKGDNKLSNLEWVSRKDAGVVAHPNGKAPTTAKLTDKEVLEIYRSDGRTQDLVCRYGVSANAIWKIRTGRSWSRLTGTLDE